MINLSQDNETLLETTKNNEINDNHFAIPFVINNFRLYGMVSNDIRKIQFKRYIVSKMVLKVAGGTTVIAFGFDKVADEIATIYKYGDWVCIEGKVSSKEDEDGKIRNYLTICSHMLIKKDMNIKSIKEHLDRFIETEQLYDPFKVQERMLKGDKKK